MLDRYLNERDTFLMTPHIHNLEYIRTYRIFLFVILTLLERDGNNGITFKVERDFIQD